MGPNPVNFLEPRLGPVYESPTIRPEVLGDLPQRRLRPTSGTTGYMHHIATCRKKPMSWN